MSPRNHSTNSHSNYEYLSSALILSLPSTHISSNWCTTYRFPNQNFICISFLYACYSHARPITCTLIWCLEYHLEKSRRHEHFSTYYFFKASFTAVRRVQTLSISPCSINVYVQTWGDRFAHTHTANCKKCTFEQGCSQTPTWRLWYNFAHTKRRALIWSVSIYSWGLR